MLYILTIIKTIIFSQVTQIQHNKILSLVITSLITINILALITKLSRKKPRRNRMVFYILFSLLLFIDTVYYSQFGNLPSVWLLGELGQLGAVSDSIGYLLTFEKLLLVLDLPILIYLARLKKDRDERNISIKLPLISLVVILVFTISTNKLSSLKKQEPYLFHLVDLGDRFSPKDPTSLTREEVEDLIERASYKEGNYTGLGHGKNLIVIQVEALQNFVIDLVYNGQEITPNLNKLARDQSSLYYSNYYQLLGRGNTSDAEFVSNNSLHPSMKEPSYKRYEGKKFYSLAELLKDYGYHTVAMHGYNKDFWNRDQAYKNQGFNEFISQEDYKDYKKIGLGVSDRDFFLQNIEYLKEYRQNNQEPFYSFMVSLTSHTPFDDLQEEDRQIKLLEREEETLLGNYLNSINYLDQQIGLFINGLKEAGLYEDTVIAIYGDHFAISNTIEEDSRHMSEFLGYRYDFDEMMRVPLIIHLANMEEGKEIENLGSQLDFYPTILNILGYENKKGLIFGRDLNNYQGENYVFPQTYMSKGSVISQDKYFVMSRDGVFNHSRAHSIKSREKVDLGEFKDAYQLALDEINRSDYILENDILGSYLKEANLDFLENLEEDQGKVKEVKLYQWENLRDFKPKEDYIKVEVFRKNGEIYLGEDLSFQDFHQWARGNKKEILLAPREEEEEILIEIFNNYYEEKPYIAEIKDFKSYLNLSFNRYSRIVLNPREMNYSRKEIRDFHNKYPDLEFNLGFWDRTFLREIRGKTFKEVK